MDARGALLIGSTTAVAASVAVASVIALTSAAALVDRPGHALADSTVVVQGRASPAPQAQAPARTAPETVPAPEPKELNPPRASAPPAAGPRSSDSAIAPPEKSAPRRTGDAGEIRKPAVRHPAATSPADLERTLREAARTEGQWRQLIDAWRSRIQSQLKRSVAPRTSADDAEDPSRLDTPRTRFGWEREQSHRSPDSGD
jgi:pyruvate/2-oxoglutarate dehydrogenase complex dihydrolipoamide acyltransferase (E2) component